MATYFAEIDENDIVIRVIVADQAFINSGVVGDPASWFETDINTTHGQHSEGGTPLRKNYASPGMKYDRVKDMFHISKPFPSWLFNEEKANWDPPVPRPTHISGQPPKDYWNEQAQQWQVRP